jgi:hypothetical protein
MKIPMGNQLAKKRAWTISSNTISNFFKSHMQVQKE